MTYLTERKNSIIAIAVTASVFLGSTGYLYIDNNKISEINRKQKSEINSLNEINRVIEKEASEMKRELEKFKGKNRELDELVVKAQGDLKIKEQKIKKLVRENISLAPLRAEIVELRRLNESYLSKISELERKLSLMTDENKKIKFENSQLLDENGKLKERNEILESKIVIASVLRTENVFVIGEKKNKSGKYVKSKLKKSDRFLVTFELIENKVAEAGNKMIYVRIIDSKGNLIQNAESGSFQNEDQNLSMSYTTKESINYNKSSQIVTIPVELNGNALEKGTYKLEFFCDGYFCGLKKLNLK